MGRWVRGEDDVGGQLGRGPVVDARAFGSIAAGQGLPGVVGCFFDELVEAPDAGEGLDLLGLRHRHDIADAELFEQAAEGPVLSVGFIGGHPCGGEVCGDAAADHVLGQLALGREGTFVGDLRLPAPLSILGPALGQVEFAVDQGPSADGGVGRQDTDLAVVDLSGSAGVLLGYPGRRGAFLDEPGVIDDEHSTRTELLADVLM